MNTIAPINPQAPLSDADKDHALLMICPALIKLRVLVFIQSRRLDNADSEPLLDMMIAEDALACAEMVVDVILVMLPLIGGPNPWSMPFQELTHATKQDDINNIVNRFADAKKRSMLRMAIACWHLRTIEGGINDDGAPGRHMTKTMYGTIDYAFRGFLEKWCNSKNAFIDAVGPDGEPIEDEDGDEDLTAEVTSEFIAQTHADLDKAQKLLVGPSEDRATTNN